ncbi:RNA methyltransferase [Imperialibacter roseus]|uniref:RNA methyltransferase n=1 Tax=Imperialibacter roseus TaxID=1324217 RepID=A0ABZ0IMR3_9BACT|nr:RNA methyltransferase [Imperialibacter roseus]WOK04867.1 RNA methyltransferase [Imperialibacter roseus]
MILEISSPQNQRIKNLIALQKPRERKEQQAFVIEGVREISLAQQSGYELQEIYLNPNLYQADLHYPISFEHSTTYHLSNAVFSKVAYRESTGGVIAIAATRSLTLAQLPKVANPLYLVLENVEKPGNIGAMLRTADAAGLSGVIVCDPNTDFFNPNVVRSSVGCLFTVPVASASNQDAKDWFASHGITTYAAALTDKAMPYHTFDYKTPSALLLGTEATGLSDFWLREANQQVIIPMKGKIDSMNVSNAAAILIYEALRQRDFG